MLERLKRGSMSTGKETDSKIGLGRSHSLMNGGISQYSMNSDEGTFYSCNSEA